MLIDLEPYNPGFERVWVTSGRLVFGPPDGGDMKSPLQVQRLQ